MRAHHPLPKGLGNTFHTSHARALGVGKERLRGRDLVTPFRSVRAKSAPRTIEELCRAYLVRAGADEFFSHATAATIWGLPLPASDPWRGLDVAVRFPSFPPQAAGVRGHRILRPIRVLECRGLPVVDPVECWIELASSFGVDDLVMIGDGLVRRVDPLASLEGMARSIHPLRGVRGVDRLRRAIVLVRSGTDSPAETSMRLILVRGGLPEPMVGHKVFDGARYVGRPDLAYVRERIALEYEGDGHRTDKRTFRQDIERKESFHDAHWRTIRVTADHLANPPALVRRVRRALAESDSGRSVANLAE